MIQKIIIVTSNNLEFDQRVHKTALGFKSKGFFVTLLGRSYRNKETISRPYNCVRLNLYFNKGVLFYLLLQIRYFFYLFFNSKDITCIWSVDLDTLLPCYLIAKFRKIKLIYDSHEYFSETPELQDVCLKKKIWVLLEKYLYPKIQYFITVNKSISEVYKKEFNIMPFVLQNVPLKSPEIEVIKKDADMVIYQGVINIDRGLEELVEAFTYLPKLKFFVAGEGDIYDELIKKAKTLGVLDKNVFFTGQLNFENLRKLTLKASLGVSIEKPIGLNYKLCLPNKFFDYMHLETPVLVSDLQEMVSIVKKYNIGEILKSYDAKQIATQIENLLNDTEKLSIYRNNQRLTKQNFIWEHQFELVYNQIFKTN